ncbi:ABC transporter ATP-binding protein [Weissella paramesenteroides]|uniref:ABC transporter ATP-binding protein n=1 Tax=Weissella paramesenteroides TaxID=1249 RepID=UPI002072FDE9|nr:ABC transporter ATP-binding protein [Weissella paramesenteroides]MCM6766179.1 ABC transporter ATP-binding protein [Weissella paramesenteroides]MCM6767555.1 ABC transporter ATP-binding protein [Weissella paramesenteroides]MCM6770270.1 ABC transporter ATP-binding protein [Weissella paramesenteroides]MCM6780193.1 ABC transporter ATP-binding protein [Weissella paramesenteroides]MCM6781236.1 ABC transporter ATP-binding protein [Weissella paramesenteroides]
MTNTMIEVSHVTKKFKHHTALNDLSFTVKKGEIFAMLGSNGVGKTTTINMLTTLMKPSKGTIKINEIDIQQYPNQIKPLISLTGQYASLDEELTGRQNLTLLANLNHLPKNQIKFRIDEVLEEFNLTEFADRIVKQYSGGMRRRLDIAGSLLKIPKILFLDEPTTGVDPENRINLWNLILEFVKKYNITVFLTTQYLEEAEYLADFAIIMNDGSLIKSGTIKQLKENLASNNITLTFDAYNFNLVKNTSLNVKFNQLRHEIMLPSNDIMQDMETLLNTLSSQNIEIENVQIKQPTLEDAYFEAINHIKD